MTKTDAAAQTLAGINPDVALESFTMNITTVQVPTSWLLRFAARLLIGLLW
jgi:ubiquitin-like modifier-activating enzyme 5